MQQLYSVIVGFCLLLWTYSLRNSEYHNCLVLAISTIDLHVIGLISADFIGSFIVRHQQDMIKCHPV